MRRMARAGTVAALMVGSLLVATPAQATEPLTFQGTITDADTGSPVAGACVALFRSPGTAETEACTDAEGRYTITDTVAGVVYRLRVRAAGYADRWHSNGVDFVSAAGIDPKSASPKVVDLAITRHAGTLRGRVTRQDGSPAPLATVRVHPAGQDSSIRTYTDVNGEYRLDHLPAGDYQISIDTEGYPEQWAPGKTTRAEAGTYSIATGAETVLDERFIAKSPMPAVYFGTMAGTVLALNTGAPVADACVSIYRLDWARAAVTCTDSAGTYRVKLPAGNGRYRVLVRHEGDPDTWAPTAPTYDVAATYYVWADATVTANAAIGGAPYGATIRGRIIDYTGTAPTERVDVTAAAANGIWRATVKAQPDGSYEFTRLPVGEYRLSATAHRLIGTNHTTQVTQWFPQQRGVENAKVVSVGSGEVASRDETLIAPAKLDLALVDDVTGAPVTTACVDMSWETQCSSADGIYRFPRIWHEPTATAVVRPGVSYFQERVEGIPVASGQTSRQTIRLRPGAVLKTRMVDNSTGAPVRGCVRAVSVSPIERLPYPPASSGPYNHCSDNDGNVSIGPLPATRVQLLATPSAPYGIQWVDETGGTGDRRQARQFITKAGTTSTIRDIRVDVAGSVSGTITDRQTGLPIRGCVEPFGWHPDLTDIGYGGASFTTCTFDDGRYTLSGLGPYAWPLHFSGYNLLADKTYAGAWSGGVSDRFAATPVWIAAHVPTRYDMALAPEGRISVDGTNGGQTPYWSATAYHPVTGDIVESTAYHRPYLGGLNTGPLVIQFSYGDGARSTCWYQQRTEGSTKRRNGTATVVNAVAGRTDQQIAITLGSTCGGRPPATFGSPVPRRPAPTTALPPRAGQQDPAAAPQAGLDTTPELVQAPGEPQRAPRSHSPWGWGLTRSASAWFHRLTETAKGRL